MAAALSCGTGPPMRAILNRLWTNGFLPAHYPQAPGRFREGYRARAQLSLDSWLFTPGPGSYSLPVMRLLYSTSDPA